MVNLACVSLVLWYLEVRRNGGLALPRLCVAIGCIYLESCLLPAWVALASGLGWVPCTYSTLILPRPPVLICSLFGCLARIQRFWLHFDATTVTQHKYLQLNSYESYES